LRWSGYLRPYLRKIFKAPVNEVLVSDAAMAQSLKFPGSPTIRINGLTLSHIADKLLRMD
jgi:hypothetical protein